MVTLQSVQGHTGLTHHFYFFDIRALWRSVLSVRVPECQKIKKGGLDQYDAERFGRLILSQSENVGMKGLMVAGVRTSRLFLGWVYSVLMFSQPLRLT